MKNFRTLACIFTLSLAVTVSAQQYLRFYIVSDPVGVLLPGNLISLVEIESDTFPGFPFNTSFIFTANGVNGSSGVLYENSTGALTWSFSNFGPSYLATAGFTTYKIDLHIINLVSGNQQTISSGYLTIPTQAQNYLPSGTSQNSQNSILFPPAYYGTPNPTFFYLGGTSDEKVYAAAVDSSEVITMTGFTGSSNFPVVSGYDGSLEGTNDIFVYKMSLHYNNIFYSTFLGGNGTDVAYSLAETSDGSVVISGATNSTNFPANAYDTSLNGLNDSFITKINSIGSAIVYSTFLGENLDDKSNSLTLDTNENVYLSGYTNSVNFPTTSGVYSDSLYGNSEIFVSKLISNASMLDFSTFLGGTNSENCTSIKIDQNGNCLLTGYTNSSDFPTANAYDASLNGDYDAFLTNLTFSGSALSYSTFFGENFEDKSNSLAIGKNENVLITGNTFSTTFPTTGGAYDFLHNGSSDVFVTKLNNGVSPAYSTFLGGAYGETANSLVVDKNESCYLTGYTASSNFPVLSSVGFGYGTGNNVFASRINTTGSVLFASYALNGDYSDKATSIFLGSQQTFYIAGHTSSYDFPMITNCWTNYHGSEDGFLCEFPVLDQIKPARVTDLSVSGFNQNNPVLSFTATGADSVWGTATKYTLYVSTSPVMTNLFYFQLPNTPQPSGSTETITVTGLPNTNTVYYFVVSIADENFNQSPFSNVASNFSKPTITSVADVPNDEGNLVAINFLPNHNETQNSIITTSSYTIYRKVTNYAPAGKTYTNQTLENLPPGTWEIVAYTPSLNLPAYTILAPTTIDSNATGIHEFEFLVRAASTLSPTVNSVSNILSGYSKDNLAPQIAQNQNFTNNGNGTITAIWNTVSTADLAFYTVYAQLNTGVYSFLGQVTPLPNTSTQSYTFNAVPNATGYEIGSKDENGNENSAHFNKISDLKIHVSGNNLTLNWTAKQNVFNYKIYRGLTPDFQTANLIGTTTNTSFTDTAEQKYFYFVTCEN